jgi:hypothetical protein
MKAHTNLHFNLCSVQIVLDMEKRAEGLIQSCVGLCVKTNDDTTVNNAVAEVPNKWLKLIDANGKTKKAKRFVFKEFRILRNSL